MPNAINVIHPYRSEGMLVFDDERKDLAREPFVGNADNILKGIATYYLGLFPKKFTVLFSGPEPHVGFQESATIVGPDSGGHVYVHDRSQESFWLCPALLRYFDEAPERLFITIREYAE